MQTSLDIKALITNGESQTVEFKSSFERETIETLVAFANTQGGHVLVGVSDNGDVIGVSLGKETLNQWLGQVKSGTAPTLIPEIEEYEVAGKSIVVITVDEYPIKPVNTRGRYYKRVASANHQLGLGEINELYMKSLQLSWDAHPAPGESLDALSIQKIDSFIVKVNESGRFSLDPSPLMALEKLKFVSKGDPTWAALLLFAEEPLRHHIHIGRFKTPSVIIDDRQITDSLFEAVGQAMKFIVSHVSVAFEFDGSLQRKERFAYPLAALREAMLNAVVHRDYTNPSDIQVKIFDNKITIFSPGRLYGGLTIEDLQTDHYQSHLRNKLIAEAFYLTGNIEKYGSGFIRIRKELETYPEVEFSVKEVGGGLLVTFNQGGGLNGGLNGGVSGGASGGVNDVLDYLKAHPGARTNEIASALGIAERTLQRMLKKLKGEQTLAFKGAPKTGGYFVLNGKK